MIAAETPITTNRSANDRSFGSETASYDRFPAETLIIAKII